MITINLMLQLLLNNKLIAEQNRWHVMKSNYYKNLIKTVLSKSDSNDWGNAVLEWEIEDWEEDE